MLGFNLSEGFRVIESQQIVKKKLILHAVDASQNGATEWTFFSLDTYIFVLCPRIYPETIFVTGFGNRWRKIRLWPIYLALGDLSTQPLPGLQSFSGADTIAWKGNSSFWKAFKDFDIGIKQVFADLGKQAVLEDHIVIQLDQYVCLLYQPDTTLVTVNELRWWIIDVSKRRLRGYHQQRQF